MFTALYANYNCFCLLEPQRTRNPFTKAEGDAILKYFHNIIKAKKTPTRQECIKYINMYNITHRTPKDVQDKVRNIIKYGR